MSLGLTGLRWGEFVALRPRDRITTAGSGTMIHVIRSIVRARGEGAATVETTMSGAKRLAPLLCRAHDNAETWADGKGRGSRSGPVTSPVFARVAARGGRR